MFFFFFLGVGGYVGTGDPGAGEPRGNIHHSGRGRLTTMHPGSVPSLINILSY